MKTNKINSQEIVNNTDKNASGESFEAMDFEDLIEKKDGVLRIKHTPDEAIRRNPLTMLSLIRLAVDKSLNIEKETWRSIRRNSELINSIDPELTGRELWGLLGAEYPEQAMKLMIDSGLMKFILPEVMAMKGIEQVGRHHHKDILKHSLQVLKNVAENSSDPVVRFAGLLHDIGKPKTKKLDPNQGWTFHGHEVIGARITGKIGRRLKIGRENAGRLTKLVKLHMRPVNLTSEGVTDSAIRRLMVEAGEDLEDQLILCRADITTANPKLVDRYLANFDEMSHRMKDVKARDRIRTFQSPISGEEIIEICNIKEGPLVGALKGRIEDAILDGRILNNHQAAKLLLIEIKEKVLNTDIETLKLEIQNRSKMRRRIDRDFQFPTDDS